MRKFHEERLKKWEAKKRSKLGDTKFLEKYIVMYKRFDKSNKIAFSLCAFLCVGLAVRRWVYYFMNQTFGNFGYALVLTMLALTWIFLVQMYFLYISYGMCGKHIERWEKEQHQENSGLKEGNVDMGQEQ